MLKNLSIPQEFVLLALDRETNKLKSIFRMHVALYTVMACIIELSINGNVTFEDDDTVRITNSASTGEKYLDRLLEIMNAEKPKKLKQWVSYFYYFKRKEIYKMVVESLVDKGVLEIEDTEVLFIVPVKKYTDVANTRNHIVEKIRAELLEHGNVEEHTLALVLFLNIKNMLNDYFSDYEQKTLKQKLEILCKEDIYKKIRTVEIAIQNIDSGL
ncbi:GPP34 family phosphoprotein [Paenibacillus sp. LjRoot153]|uniref:GOLPH3/VPS74 family protein n=1 Tax=Paenibacillus sp. LjRoot153 TaxID=3342270 RepID=UPI003ECF4749